MQICIPWISSYTLDIFTHLKLGTSYICSPTSSCGFCHKKKNNYDVKLSFTRFENMNLMSKSGQGKTHMTIM